MEDCLKCSANMGVLISITRDERDVDLKASV